MGVSIQDWASRSRTKVAELTVHLVLHVERLLAARDPALVAGDHELADLVPERLVAPSLGRTREPRHLRIHVERGLSARLAAGRLRLHQLADLRPRLGPRR